MLPAFALPAPPAPTGTTTTAALCAWLSEATGVPHAVGGELRDYPVFLSVRSGEPGRIKALVATALAGEWERDGSTVRLVPVKPKPDEGLAEFEREWRLATATRANFAALPAREVSEMKAGEILRFGLVPGPYVRPLPDALRKKVEASDVKVGEVVLRRFTNGVFETKVTMPDERKGVFDQGAQVEFRSLPPEVAAALGEEGKKPALTPDDLAAIRKITANPAATKVDPKTIDRTDPLARFIDPVLKPLAGTLNEDLVVALPDFAMMGLMGDGATTVEGIMRTFCQFDDWTAAPGAFVGRLPVSERRDRAQTRRAVIAEFVRSTREVGVPGSAALAEYLSAQRPQASEGWTDVMMLVMSGVVLDQTFVGDYPFNLRLGAALTDGDWARLRSGRPMTIPDLSPAARSALLAVLVQSRKNMGTDGSDPVGWRGFPNVPMTIVAKVEEEPILIGFQSGINTVMEPRNAGYGYRRAKTTLGAEPLYRPGRRRKVTLTVTNPAEGEPVTTGFADVSFEKDAKAVPWTELPPDLRKEFETMMKVKENQEPPPGGSPEVAPLEPPHVATLNAYARALAEAKGRPVPLFDPLDGGVEARLLVLMESPSRRGIAQGHASADNPTPTGKRMREEFAAAGLRREDRAIWNVVPWYLGDETKARNPTPAERREGAALLPSFLALLPRLQVVLTLGAAARDGWRSLGLDTTHVAAPHPSNTNLCARPWALEEFRAALREVASLL